jgi:hypothetical protein
VLANCRCSRRAICGSSLRSHLICSPAAEILALACYRYRRCTSTLYPLANLPQSPLRLIRRQLEYVPLSELPLLPAGLRGIYVLYRHVPARGNQRQRYEVVYVGMATRGGIRGRLRSHRRNKRDLWTHCSIFEVWDNIRDDEIAELEGLFRHLYRHDSAASALNKQRSFKAMKRVERITLSTPKPRRARRV